MQIPTLEDVVAAREFIAPYLPKTPLIRLHGRDFDEARQACEQAANEEGFRCKSGVVTEFTMSRSNM